MAHANPDEVRRREDLLDRLVLLLAKAPLNTPEDLSQHVAEWLADQHDGWDIWVIGAREGDYLSWKIVRALVVILRDSEPERLKEPPLFDWVLDVALGHCPEPARGRGTDGRLYRVRHRAIASIVALLSNPPDGPDIWNEGGDSACDLVAARLKLASEQGLLPKAYAVKPNTVCKNYKRYRAKLGKARVLGNFS